MLLVLTLIAAQNLDVDERKQYDPNAPQDLADLQMMSVAAYNICHAVAPNSPLAARAHALKRDLLA
jgi:hypothetical protein